MQIDQWIYILEPATDQIWNQILADGVAPRFGFGKGIINLQEGLLYKTLDGLSAAITNPGKADPFDNCFQNRKKQRN